MPITGRLITHTIGSSPAGRRSRRGEGANQASERAGGSADMSEPHIELETVKVHMDAGAATVEMNRPETLNAWNAQFGADLLAALRSVAVDEGVRAVVLTGAGRG